MRDVGTTNGRNEARVLNDTQAYITRDGAAKFHLAYVDPGHMGAVGPGLDFSMVSVSALLELSSLAQRAAIALMERRS